MVVALLTTAANLWLLGWLAAAPVRTLLGAPVLIRCSTVAILARAPRRDSLVSVKAHVLNRPLPANRAFLASPAVGLARVGDAPAFDPVRFSLLFIGERDTRAPPS